MITWLMVGLLLFTESACDRGKSNAVSAKTGKNGSASAASPGNGNATAIVGPSAAAVSGGAGDKAATNSAAAAKATTTTTTTDEEDVYRLTCYTCVNVSDNKMCNEWAIDTPCPAGGWDFCRSLHILDSRGQSVLVSKSCASKNECSPASVGCVPVDTQKICISCCDTSYCNVESPTNSTNATYSRKRPDHLGKKKKKKKKNKHGDDATDDLANDIDDDDDDESSHSGASSHQRQRLLRCLVLGFSAINVFLNRAYH
ncbi:uncharacterized protein LOC106646617 [Copidosoma floridanum]|uniref:uncharacterized protein LOC106646617 n=1 Tax=Copidosoma floridanum TaxID=29053 RepID=UPI0006C97D9C|nr:uncharacterized protein LOC106646617 [Copidosoma floridanum]